MKLSKREQASLLVVIFVGIAIIYYQFVYVNFVNKVNEKTTAKAEIEERYKTAIESIDALETQKSKVKILNSKINEEADQLYPTISQEHIILELDKLLKENGLEGGMTFEKTEVKAVEAIKKSEKDKELGQSSVQTIVDDFNSKYGLGKANSVSSTSNSSKTTDSSNKSSDAKAKEGNTVTQLKAVVDFTGNYESVNKFLNAIGNQKRKMPVYALSMTKIDEEKVKGTAAIVIYSIPKIDDDLNTYLKWDLNNTYGKFRPFAVDSVAGTGIKSEKATSDFLIQVNPSTSELPTIIMGKTDDNARSTYAYGDGNNVQEAEIVLTEKDGKYYYKYKTNIDKIPGNYEDLGNEFVPSGENITINILTEGRTDSNDKSGLKLKIVNNTQKYPTVGVFGDDEKDPRVTIDGDKKNLSIFFNKK